MVSNNEIFRASNYLDTLGTEEKQRIKDRTDGLIKLLEEWARRYPSVRKPRIATTALTTAVITSRMSPTDSLLAAKMVFWAFKVDDEADEQRIPLPELREKSEQWCRIVDGGSSDEINDSGEIFTMLLEIREELSKLPLFESLGEYWSREVPRFLEAQAQEYQYALEYEAYGPRALPSLDEYVASGLHSIAISPWILTVLLASGDPSVGEHIDFVIEAIEHASAAVRLYNDLNTFDKEMQESGINSIVIVYHALLDRNPNATEGRVLSEAERYILQLADSYAQKCYDLVSQVQTSSGQFEESISRTIAFTRYFYSKYDYHTTPLPELYEIIDV